MTYLNKLLYAVSKNSTLFKEDSVDFIVGVTNSQLKELKRESILAGYLVQKKQEYFLTDAGKNYLKEHPILSWKTEKYSKRPEINLEYLKLQKMPPSVTKAVRDLAKVLLDNESISYNYLSRNILKEVKEKCSNLVDEIEVEILSSKRVELSTIFERYLSYGLTKSIISVILLLIFSKNIDKIAIYERGQFQLKLDYLLFDRMMFAPKNFAVQKIVINDNPILEEISEIVLPFRTSNVINITKGLLYLLRKLDKYALNTERISKKAIRFRNIVMSAKDPVKLFERDIPKVLVNKSLFNSDVQLVRDFESVMNELKDATSNMEDEIRKFTFYMFKVDSKNELINKFSKIEEYITNQELKVLFNNITDNEENEKLWFRRIATFINKLRVPMDWSDYDVADYKLKIKELSLKIEAIESIVDGLKCSFSDKFKELLDEVSNLSCAEKNVLIKKIVNG